MHLVVIDEGAVDPGRVGGAGGHVEHVPHAEQGFGAALIQDGAGIYLARHLERDPGRDVGLDEAGDDIHRGALGRENEVNTGCPRLLGDTGDQLFHLLADDHHHVGEFVHHHHYVGQFFQLRRHLIHGVTRTPQGIPQGLALGGRGQHLVVVTLEVAHPDRGHQLVATLHLADAPAQGVGGILHVGDHLGQQMGDTFVDREFQHLGVDHDEAQIVRRRLVEHGDDHGVDPHRLARASGTGHQQVGHLGQVHHHGFPRDVLPQPHGQRIVAAREGLAVQGLTQVDGLAHPVGQLDADKGLARDNLHHPHTAGGERTGEIPGEIGDLARLHARRQIQFEAGDDGARIDADHLGLHVVVGEFRLHQPAHAVQLVLAHHLGLGGRAVEQLYARQRRHGGLGATLGLDRCGHRRRGSLLPFRPGQIEFVIPVIGQGRLTAGIGNGGALGSGHGRRLVLFIIELRIELEGVVIELRQPFVRF